MNYIVIRNSEGETRVEQVTKAELTERLNEDYYGLNTSTFDGFPAEPDTNHWGGKIMIIKGELVTPKPVKVITEWEM